ncbi:MAG: VCBS repeat-containing protein [Syntrophaceae bacterium]|nr:VCBS repeat-containing protein [Syntrophaceae bacterium]
MTPVTGSRLIFGVFLVLAISTFAGSVDGSEKNHQPLKVITLPFSLLSGASDDELKSFCDHATDTVKSIVNSMGNMVIVIPDSAFEKFMKDKVPFKDDKEAVKLAQKVGAEMAIFGFLSREDNQYRMRGIMWNVAANKPTVSTDIRVDNIHALPSALNMFAAAISKRLTGVPKLEFYKSEGMSPAATLPSRNPALVSLPGRSSQPLAPWRSPEMSMGIASVTVGDLDGDGKNEVVFLDENGITISRFEDGGLKPLTRFSQAPAIYVSAEAKDLDGSGIAELILCYRTLSGFESAIIQYRGMNLKVVDQIPDVILKVISEPVDGKEKQLLVGQRIDSSGMFSGKMERYEFKDGKLKRVGEIDLPPGTFLLSYASGRFGPDNQFLRIILSQDQRLMAFDQDNRLVATKLDKLYGLHRRIRLYKQGQSPVDIEMPGRILISNSQGVGQNEILVTKQSEAGSAIEALGWNGKQFVEDWRTVNSPGIISDYLITDFKNEGIKSLVLVLVNPMFFKSITGYRSVIFAYDISSL